MAHDNQIKDCTSEGVRIRQVEPFDFPKEGELYWDRYIHKVKVAGRDMNEKFLIVEEEEENAS